MRTLLHAAAVPVASLTILAGSAAAQANPTGLAFRVGDRFPEVVLPSADDGRPMSLADFRGKKLILHIFASW